VAPENSRSPRKPPWIRIKRTEGKSFARVRRTLRAHGLGTVCEEARCPNKAECWGCGTATFLLMGRQCTRSCKFCSVEPGRASAAPEADEPDRVAAAVADLGLRHAVLTSVSRDDLPDGGAGHYARTIGAIRAKCEGVRVEALVPDYLGESLDTVLEASPDVLAHNVEVVREITESVRDRRSSYERSLRVLSEARARRPSGTTKSSLLLGFGETDEQAERCLRDLREARVDMVCIGQYLQPTSRHVQVDRYVTPERFAELEGFAKELGFSAVASGPLVRTSYLAAELSEELDAGRSGR